MRLQGFTALVAVFVLSLIAKSTADQPLTNDGSSLADLNEALEGSAVQRGVTLLTTESYTDFVRAQDRTSLVILVKGLNEAAEVKGGWLRKIVRDGHELQSQSKVNVAVVDVGVDRMMITMLPPWLRGVFRTSRYHHPIVHVLLTRGDGTSGVVLRRWTGLYWELRPRMLPIVAALGPAPLVHPVEDVGHLWSKLSALSRGNMALVASAGNDKDRALLTPLLAEFSRLWGLRGTAVDQPQDGGGDGILPTLLTLPNDATTKKGHASIKVMLSSHANAKPAVTWTLPLQSSKIKDAAMLLLKHALSFGVRPLVDSSVDDAVLMMLMEGWIDEDFEPTRRYAGAISCGKNAEVDPVATPALQDLLMAHRETFNWFCASPDTMADRSEWPKKALKFWDDQEATEEAELTAAIIDSVSYWYTGPDITLAFTPEYGLLDWANERERMKLEAAIEYIVVGGQRASAWSRKKALEKLDVSTEAFVLWMLKENAEDKTSYNSKEVSRVFSFLYHTRMDQSIIDDVTDFFAKSKLRSSETPQLETLRAYRDERMDVALDLDEAERDQVKMATRTFKRVANVIAKRDRLCINARRAHKALTRVVTEIEAKGNDCCAAELAELKEFVTGPPVACETFLGYYNEWDILKEVKAKGPALVADVVRQLDERIHALYDSSEPGKKKGSVSLKPFYLATLKEAEALQQLMNDMTAAGNKAATAFLKSQGKLGVTWDGEWPFKNHIEPVPVLDASTLTLEQFGQYAEDGIPVIITGLDMTAHQPWDLPFINSTCGSMSLDIGDVKKQLKHMKAWGGLMTANAAPMTLGELIKAQTTGNASTEGWYMADESMQRRCVAAFGPPPFDGLRPPPYIAVDYFQLTNFSDGGYPIHGPSGFCGNKGTGTAVHEDAQLTNFWMWLSHGEKHWRMFKPADRALLYHDEDLSSFGPDVFNVDLEAYPLTAFADIFEVRLQPGQLLFAPSGSIHAVRNTGEINFGVSTNYVDKWGVHFAFLYHIVQDGEDELAWHMERMLRPSEEDHGIGTANSGIRTVTNAWTEQVWRGVEAPSSSIPYGTFRAQGRLYGRDKPFKDALDRLQKELKPAVEVAAA